MSDDKDSSKLVLTERGELWLQNFVEKDRPTARILAGSLTLISEIEFERELIAALLNFSQKIQGNIALFSVRELRKPGKTGVDDCGEHVFQPDGTAIDSTPRGHDIGSEGRVAAILRNFVRGEGSGGKFLNSPSILEMRQNKCVVVIFLDDFIGSGRRVATFINSFYENLTIKSWFSRKKFKTSIICYSGTAQGIKKVRTSKTAPTVIIVRSCPTIDSKLWDSGEKKSIKILCKTYARKNSLAYPLGYDQVGALMIFEHSCPNNVPGIFWSSKDNSPWIPLFEGKAVSLDVRRIFPPEILKNDPTTTLIQAGENRMARSANTVINRPLPGEWLAALSLCSKGVRRVDALEGVSRMNHIEATNVMEKCVAAGLLTQHWRLTKLGSAELLASQRATIDDEKELSKIKKEDYYPYALRSH
ncbi:hypothetical protein MRBLMS1_000393 [Massilia sp. LMS1-1-1.1]